jgi:hypothetical protein
MNILLSFILSIVMVTTTVDSFRVATIARPAAGRQSITMQDTKKGVPSNFNYDPSNYKDSNSGNYRRLGDQLAARKAEEEQLLKERNELLRKEQMAAMFIKQENSTFWDTPGHSIVAKSDQFFIDPEVLQVIADLDNQLIGLKPVKEKMRRYAAQMLSHKIRQYV